eukprot:12654448-Alexandrium_andersonii.AAC.1
MLDQVLHVGCLHRPLIHNFPGRQPQKKTTRQGGLEANASSRITRGAGRAMSNAALAPQP